MSPGAGTGTRPPEMGEGGGVAALAPAPEVGDEQLVWVAWEGEAAGRVLPAQCCCPHPEPEAGGAQRDRVWTARRQPRAAVGCLLARFEGPWEGKRTESVKRVSGATPASASRNACPVSFPPVPGPALAGFGAVFLHPGQEGIWSEASLRQRLRAVRGRGCFVAC